MERLRAEVLWDYLSLSQRIALKAMLCSDYHFEASTHWKQLTPGQQEALLRLDWEFCVGKKFPELKAK